MDSKYPLIYLDASATCPPHFKVLSEIAQVEKNFWANPSSLHDLGIKALDILERSRINIANCFNVDPTQVLITSGATEASHLAIKGYANSIHPGRIVISSVEHPSVSAAANSLKQRGWDVEYWQVDKYGLIDISLLDKYLSPPTKIVSMIWGQNEIGTIQPITTIGKECKKRNIFFHTDATQVISQGLFDFNKLEIGAFSASAHKFRGPKGIGLLIMKQDFIDSIIPIQGGGGQEYGLRSGTQSVSLAHGMSIALEQIPVHVEITDGKISFQTTKTTSLTKCLADKLFKLNGLSSTGHPVNRLPNLISLIACSQKNIPVSARRLVRELSSKGIYVSSGSACSSNKNKTNSILEAIKIDHKFIDSSLRISLGNWLTELDVTYISKTISTTIEKIALSS